jgi:hypothetical protein
MSSRYSLVRLHTSTRNWLDRLRGEDYTLDQMVNILLEDFIEEDDDGDDDQMTLFDYDDDDD